MQDPPTHFQSVIYYSLGQGSLGFFSLALRHTIIIQLEMMMKMTMTLTLLLMMMKITTNDDGVDDDEDNNADE